MRVTKNKLKSEYGALSGDIKASNGGGTPKKATATPTKNAATPSSKSGPPSSRTLTPGSTTPKKTTPATGNRGRPGGKKSRAEMEEADGVDAPSSSGGSEIGVETPVAKKAKVNGVKREENDELEFGDENLFQ